MSVSLEAVVFVAYLSSRLWTSSQASWRLSSVYIRKRMRRPHARLLVSCFNRLGLDFPLKPADTPIRITINHSLRKVPAALKLKSETNPTCFPQQCPLLVVGIKGLGETVWLQQAVQQLEKLLRGQVPVHTLVLGLCWKVCYVWCIALGKKKKKDNFTKKAHTLLQS